MDKQQTMTPQSVYLFVPNIIGYVRIVVLITSFYFMPFNYKVSSVCYAVSSILDAVDGYAARYLKQCTKFGAILDQLTDRFGTMGLCVTLAYFYPEYMLFFQLSIAIDISCHWMFLHTSTLQGKESHKLFDSKENKILNIYYTRKTVLFLICAGNEAFYLSLYLQKFTSWSINGVSFFVIVSYLTAPVAIAKIFISLLHGYTASRNLVLLDIKERERHLRNNESDDDSTKMFNKSQ